MTHLRVQSLIRGRSPGFAFPAFTSAMCCCCIASGGTQNSVLMVSGTILTIGLRNEA